MDVLGDCKTTKWYIGPASPWFFWEWLSLQVYSASGLLAILPGSPPWLSSLGVLPDCPPGVLPDCPPWESSLTVLPGSPLWVSLWVSSLAVLPGCLCLHTASLTTCHLSPFCIKRIVLLVKSIVFWNTLVLVSAFNPYSYQIILTTTRIWKFSIHFWGTCYNLQKMPGSTCVQGGNSGLWLSLELELAAFW